jgi:hypothetical protein
MPTNRTPGPDGFNVEFFTSFWDLIKCDLTSAIDYFFTAPKGPQSFNNTFIYLIPKKSNATNLTDFHPISLCNVSYKIASSSLTNRMSNILPKLISEE